jgi:23S rRNA (uridine2552-2'-O)-methyltransferase
MYRRKDAFYHRAKDKGFRSRAAFKLQELARNERLFRNGDRVIDLGAWPGGWLQIAAELVGSRGRVIGVDRRPIEALSNPNVHFITGDASDAEIGSQVWSICGDQADVILSDLAPSLTGVRDRDEAAAEALVDVALAYVARGLRPGGSLLIKLFMSGGFKATVAKLESWFESVKLTRPEATRKGSSELYALARRRRSAPRATDGDNSTQD